MSEDAKITQIFYALSDPARLKILFLLVENGRTNVRNIASKFEISRSAISYHLKILKDAEIVDCIREGGDNYYWAKNHLVADTLRKFADQIDSLNRSA